MDVSFSNVLEGTRQYFMGLPKPAGENPAQHAWPPAAGPGAPPEEGAPALSGAPTPTARPPSAAAAPAAPPPRPPSEPLEPEPHIIHKATVMREAAEKRREQPDVDDEAEARELSPPPHVIRRPTHALPSPAPAPAAPCPSPARPPSAAPPPAPEPAPQEAQYRPQHGPAARPQDPFAPSRPPDPYSASRPPEGYGRYHYEPTALPPRHSPQTYARLSSNMPAHAARLRDAAAAHSPPAAQRYAMPAPPPANDRVPPIHHPPQHATHPPPPPRHEPSPYSRSAPHYDRHPTLPQRKYDPQQAYPGYRPAPSAAAAAPQPLPPVRPEPHAHPVHAPYKSAAEGTPRGLTRPDRSSYHDTRQPHDAIRRDYSSIARPLDAARSSYLYPTPSTSARYGPAAPAVPPASLVQSSTSARPAARAPAAPKSTQEYPTTNHVLTSPARSTSKPGYPNQARMTVSVTSLVNQMNQTKQKRESPLDLSVKTVKNSADSSTTQDDAVDSATSDKHLPIMPLPTSSTRPAPGPAPAPASAYVESHKVDFAPNFTQYRERPSSASHSYVAAPQPAHPPPVRYNGRYETPRSIPELPYHVEPRHTYPEHSKYPTPTTARPDNVPRIDLTRPISDERRPDNRIRDDRHFIIEERKRPSGPIVSNIPEKIVRYETWAADSRIDRMAQSAREQHELMSRPVYSYSSHKQFEAYHNEQKRATATSTAYREHYPPLQNHRYPPYPEPAMARDRGDNQGSYHDRPPSINNRHVIQKIPSHRDVIPSHHLDHHSGVPADKRVLSILRNSLETKHTGLEPARPTRLMPDVIVLDDVDDPVIEITDDAETSNTNVSKLPRISYSKLTDNLGQHIQMPKAVDSLPLDSDYKRHDGLDPKCSPENDVARIRTKGELKHLPLTDCSLRQDSRPENDHYKPLPKSQKQHLFNQMRQDNLRFESVIKREKSDTLITAVKPEPMNIDEIEKDAVIPIKTENLFESLQSDNQDTCSLPEEDSDWANACDSFMEQLKTGVHKKKINRRRTETMDHDNENSRIPKIEPEESIPEKENQRESTEQKYVQGDIETESAENESANKTEPATKDIQPIIIKQEPIEDYEMKNSAEDTMIIETAALDTMTKEIASNLTQSDGEVEVHVKKEESEKTSETLSVDSDKDKKSPKKKTTPKSSPTKDNIKVKRRILDKDSPIKETDNQIQNKDKSKIKRRLLDKVALMKGADKRKIKITTEEKANDKTRRADINDTNMIKQKKNLDKQGNTVEYNLNNSKYEISEKIDKDSTSKDINPKAKNKADAKHDAVKPSKNNDDEIKSSLKEKIKAKGKKKSERNTSTTPKNTTIKKELLNNKPLKTVMKEEPDSTDDDEPLINRKLFKEKELKYQLLKDLSEKSAYVKLECFDVDMNKNTRISIDSITKDKESKLVGKKILRKTTRLKGKSQSLENCREETQQDDTSTSDDEDLTVASRLRVRKITKTEDSKATPLKTPVKSSPKKQQDIASSSSSTPVRKSGFGDGSDFHPGWEEELYRYKRSLRMPARLIAVPRGRSGGPFGKAGALFTRGSTSLPDLDPTPLSPAPSLASAATDDLCARRQDKLNVDSDLESNSSSSILNRLHYDSEASTSTVFSSSTKPKKKANSIVDVLMEKCGKRDDCRKKGKDKDKEKDEKTIVKIIPRSTNQNELLPTPSLGLVKNGNKGILSAKKEKLMEDIFYLGAFRKETVTAFRNAFINNTDGLIGATEEFSPVVLKTRTRTESKVLKHRATIKEVFGDERPASAPPTSCRSDDEKQEENEDDKPIVRIKQEKETEPDAKPKMKPKKNLKDKILRRSSTIRDGLRSTKSLKRNDAKGRLMRLKKRNSLITHTNKRIKEIPLNKIKKEKSDETTEDKPKEGSSVSVEGTTKRRLKRLFGRRKFSSGFDYIRKKKKIVRRAETSTPNNKIRRPAVKPSPESVHDIQKEIKGWIVNKSVGETHLHRAARLGYTDCVAYCLEKMSADPSAKDNAGYTPLHVAAQKGHVRIARLLLQYGANVSAAAQGGIRPLHEASENCHVEVMRLLLSYGADPLLGTYSGQTPEELTEGPAARFMRLHIADVQGHTRDPWRFPHPAEIIDREELGCDPLSSPPPGSPPPPADSTIEMQCTETPLPPFYSLRSANGQPADGLWCLLQDVTTILQIKSKDSLLKQIHCGSGSPKELLREIRTQDFLERAQCHQLLCAGEKVNVRASKVSLVRVTDKLRQLLKIETVLIS